MIETLNERRALSEAPAVTRPALPAYHGPDRRSPATDAPAWSAHLLDEIDYGMLIVDASAQVSFINHAARLELDAQHPLQLVGRILRAQRMQDVAPLYEALAAAQRGLRRLLTLGEGAHRVSISVVPVQADPRSGAPLTLLLLGKRSVCAHLSVQGFARSVALTPTETRVLELLCAGVQPTDIARQQGVAISTVRTQIGSIRSKTGASSIRDLVRQIAVLPPLVGALRGAAAANG
jgi:DNA-binding CsgD family transcriptional regulator